MRKFIRQSSVVGGVVAVGFGAMLTLGIATAQGQGSVSEYCESVTSDTAGYRSCTTNPNANGFDYQKWSQAGQSSTPSSDEVNRNQKYHNDCVGPSDVNPNWQPKAYCSQGGTDAPYYDRSWQNQGNQQVPTAVPAGGAPSVSYDVSDRSADTLVLN